MIKWSEYSFNINSNGFFRVCSTLRTNIFLSSYCYY
uniref:BLTX775 n=1 Tax=Nephila pilipes TaxID=299642 RepID=A0A076KVL1_NEPPI|nr:BLTX775 [Nephila pilipes]